MMNVLPAGIMMVPHLHMSTIELFLVDHGVYGSCFLSVEPLLRAIFEASKTIQSSFFIRVSVVIIRTMK